MTIDSLLKEQLYKVSTTPEKLVEFFNSALLQSNLTDTNNVRGAELVFKDSTTGQYFRLVVTEITDVDLRKPGPPRE